MSRVAAAACNATASEAHPLKRADMSLPLPEATPNRLLLRPWCDLCRSLELAAKDSEVMGLRREVAELRAAQERARLSGDELGSAQEERASLRRERNALQKQVRTMRRAALAAGCCVRIATLRAVYSAAPRRWPTWRPSSTNTAWYG